MKPKKLTKKMEAVLARVQVPPVSVTVKTGCIESTACGDLVTKLYVDGNRFKFAEKLRALAEHIASTEEFVDTVVGGEIVVLLRRNEEILQKELRARLDKSRKRS